MPDPSLFRLITVCWLLIGVAAFVALRFLAAGYGRYVSDRWGPRIPARAGWMVMESVSLLLFGALFFTSERVRQPASLLLFGLWTVHYLQRSYLYPLRARMRQRQMPVSVVAMAIGFNIVNASINGLWLFHLGPALGPDWLRDPRLIAGTLLFVAGMYFNVSSDAQLRALRTADDSGYRVPPDIGLFRWVSCPNYLGEIVEWCGWALATWSLAGLSFAVWTVCNLAPRALTHHRWYREQFADYPPQRRALIPFVL